MIAPVIAPRWFLIAASLLLVNLVAVLGSGVWRHVGADEPQPATVAGTAAQPPASVSTSTAPPTNPVNNIPVPDGLPVIPSLASPAELQDDPGFQEFSRLFSKVEESWEGTIPAAASSRVKAESAEYFIALDQRLLTAQQLCESARAIAADAARMASQGRQSESESLLKMAIQLRDMAAKLLVSEL